MRKLLLIGAAVAALSVSGTANAAACVMTAAVEECTFDPISTPQQFAVTFAPDGTISAHIGREGIGSTTDIGPGIGTPGSPLSFVDTYFFIVDADGLGSGSVSTSLSGLLTALLNPTNVDFSSVTINGTPVPKSPTGDIETAGITNYPVTNGAPNFLVISGTARGNGSYGGNLTFTPTPSVPEPATWAMMLLGFGAVGFGMRRRNKQQTRVRFAV
jgi:hypothetical protein